MYNFYFSSSLSFLLKLRMFEREGVLNYSVLVFVVYSLFDLSLFGSCSIFLIGSDFAFRLLSLSLFAEEYVFLFYLFPSIILTSM